MKKRFFVFCGLIVIMMYLTSCSLQVDISDFQGKRGNTNLNISQGGFAARDGNFIYFTTNDCLYEMDIRDEKILCLPDINPIIGYLNIINSYVICPAMDKSKFTNYTALHRLDGKYTKVLDKNMYIPILVVDEWVYANMGKGGPLYRFRLDGKNESMLTDEPVAEFHVMGEWIYYLSELKIRKMKVDGSEKSDVFTEANVSGFYLEPDMNTLYYRNLDDDYKIYKAKLSEEFSSEKIIDYPCVYFQKKGDDILFDNTDEELYVVSLTDKGGKPKLVARDINAMNILDDIVLIKDNSGNIYMLTDDYQAEMLEIPE